MYDRPSTTSGTVVTSARMDARSKMKANKEIEQMRANEEHPGVYALQTNPSILDASTKGRGEIAIALDAQEKAACELEEMVRVLTQKLHPVLAPSPAKEAGGEDHPEYGSPIANCVQSNTHRINTAMRILGALIRDVAL